MLNSVNLIGRLTRDPELKSTPNGVSTCGFTLAVDRNFAREGEEKKADFITCVAWRQTAELIARYFKKGNMLALEGSIQVRSWEDSDGARRYVTEVVVNRVHFIESRKERESDTYSPYSQMGSIYGGNSEAVQSDGYGSLGEQIVIGSEDDLPF